MLLVLALLVTCCELYILRVLLFHYSNTALAMRGPHAILYCTSEVPRNHPPGAVLMCDFDGFLRNKAHAFFEWCGFTLAPSFGVSVTGKSHVAWWRKRPAGLRDSAHVLGTSFLHGRVSTEPYWIFRVCRNPSSYRIVSRTLIALLPI